MKLVHAAGTVIGIMFLQETVSLYLDHYWFAKSNLCSSLENIKAAGKFAAGYCAEHSRVAEGSFNLQTWLMLFWRSNIIWVIGGLLLMALTKWTCITLFVDQQQMYKSPQKTQNQF